MTTQKTQRKLRLRPFKQILLVVALGPVMTFVLVTLMNNLLDSSAFFLSYETLIQHWPKKVFYTVIVVSTSIFDWREHRFSMTRWMRGGSGYEENHNE